jgi:TusA-related sulfurtransferase
MQSIKGATRQTLDVRGRTITTAIVWAIRERLAELEVGDEIDLDIEPFPAIVPDLEAWCRATGHELVDLRRNGESWRIRLRKVSRAATSTAWRSSFPPTTSPSCSRRSGSRSPQRWAGRRCPCTC